MSAMARFIRKRFAIVYIFRPRAMIKHTKIFPRIPSNDMIPFKIKMQCNVNKEISGALLLALLLGMVVLFGAAVVITLDVVTSSVFIPAKVEVVRLNNCGARVPIATVMLFRTGVIDARIAVEEEGEISRLAAVVDMMLLKMVDTVVGFMLDNTALIVSIAGVD